jgi:hypothetical protein
VTGKSGARYVASRKGLKGFGSLKKKKKKLKGLGSIAQITKNKNKKDSEGFGSIAQI